MDRIQPDPPRQPQTLAQEEDEFTNEGAPPPGVVGSDLPARLVDPLAEPRPILSLGRAAHPIGVRPEVVDDEIESGIKAAFLGHAAIDARRVSATHVDGNVTLTGSVSSWSERDEAVRATWAAAGVTGVLDGLTVVPLNKPTRIVAPASDEECQ